VCDSFAPELRLVTRARRFSQAIAEGDGISIVVHVDDPDAARAAEEQGAEAVALRRPLDGLNQATSLPLLWLGKGTPHDADAVAIRPRTQGARAL